MNLAYLMEQLRVKEEETYRNDVVAFINNEVWTFDPRPDVVPHDVRFELYGFQEEYTREVYEAIINGHDLFTEKSRDMGASWINLAVRWWFWRFYGGYQGLLGSRKEDYVDNGQIDSLFGKLRYITDKINSRWLPKGFDVKKHLTYMKMVNPENGNAIIGESSNKNFSRAGRYTDILYDELGFWPDARNAWQAGGDATKSRHAITTPPNEPSFAKALRYSDQIKVITLHWTKHPKKDQSWYEYQKSRRTEDEMLHEIDISWEYSAQGRPYPEADKCEFGQFPYDPELPLYLYIDLGLDGVALQWHQPVRNSDWWTMVDAYEFSDKIIDFALPFFGKPVNSQFIYNDKDIELIELVKYWKPPISFGDPSGKQKHVESGYSPYDVLRQNGIIVQTNDKANDFITRREETKKYLMRMRVNDTPRTRWAMQCIKSARYPKREETSQATTPVYLPVHDWTSHHRTSLEFGAVNVNDVNTQGSKVATYRRSYAVR